MSKEYELKFSTTPVYITQRPLLFQTHPGTPLWQVAQVYNYVLTVHRLAVVLNIRGFDDAPTEARTAITDKEFVSHYDPTRKFQVTWHAVGLDHLDPKRYRRDFLVMMEVLALSVIPVLPSPPGQGGEVELPVTLTAKLPPQASRSSQPAKPQASRSSQPAKPPVTVKTTIRVDPNNPQLHDSEFKIAVDKLKKELVEQLGESDRSIVQKVVISVTFGGSSSFAYMGPQVASQTLKAKVEAAIVGVFRIPGTNQTFEISGGFGQAVKVQESETKNDDGATQPERKVKTEQTLGGVFTIRW